MYVGRSEGLAEARAAARHEYVGGYAYAMTGTTTAHNRITANVYMRLRSAEGSGPCRAYIIDLKVRAGENVYYPDIVVTCDPHEGTATILDRPCLVVEVTSRGTRRIDHGEKLSCYQSIASLRGYLVVEQRYRHASLYARAADGAWTREEVSGTGDIVVPCPSTVLSLDGIYEGVELPPLSVEEDLALYDDTGLPDLEEVGP